MTGRGEFSRPRGSIDPALDLPALVDPEPLVEMLAHMGLKMVVQGLRHLFCGGVRNRRVDQIVVIVAVLAPRRLAWDQQRVIFQREFRGRERGLGRMAKERQRRAKVHMLVLHNPQHPAFAQEAHHARHALTAPRKEG